MSGASGDNSALDYFDSPEAEQQSKRSIKKSFDIRKILSYFKGMFIILLIVIVLCILGFVAFSTVYVMQKIKFRRIMARIKGDRTSQITTPMYLYTDPIVIRGKAMQPENFIFQVSVVLAYDEKDKNAGPVLLSQRSMIQDQIRTYFSENLNGRLTVSKENKMKADLKEWLNTLLSADYIQQIYFTDYIVDN